MPAARDRASVAAPRAAAARGRARSPPWPARESAACWWARPGSPTRPSDARPGRERWPRTRALRLRALSSSLGDLREPAGLLRRDLRRERQVLRIAHHGLLAFAAHDELHELVHQRVDGLRRIAVEVRVDLVGERIAAVLHGLQRVRHVGAGGCHRERQHLERRQRSHAGQRRRRRREDADSVLVLRQLLVQAALERALLRDEVGIGLHLLVPLVAALQDAIRDRRRLVIAQVEPVGNDRLGGPLAREAELAPGADVLLRTALPLRAPARAFPAAQALGAEDAVELFHGDLVERVVLVHHDAEAGIPAGDVERPGRDLDLARRPVLVALEELALREGDLHADPEVAHAEDERGHGGARGLHVPLDLRVGVILAESLLPVAAHLAVSDVVAFPDAQRALHLLLRLVRGQAGEVEFLRVRELRAARAHHLRARLLHVEAFGGRALFERFGLGERGQRDAREQRPADLRDEGSVDHGNSSRHLSFFSSSRTASALSGRYLPSFCTSSWPSRDSTKRMNSRTLGGRRSPFFALTQNDWSPQSG